MEMLEQAGERSKSFAPGKCRGLRHFLFGTSASFCHFERRNVSKGQQAIALAMLYPEPEKGGRGKKSANAKESLGFTTQRLSEARSILEYSRELALAIRERKPAILASSVYVAFRFGLYHRGYVPWQNPTEPWQCDCIHRVARVPHCRTDRRRPREALALGRY
jgi:hypothetical protein